MARLPDQALIILPSLASLILSLRIVGLFTLTLRHALVTQKQWPPIGINLLAGIAIGLQIWFLVTLYRRRSQPDSLINLISLNFLLSAVLHHLLLSASYQLVKKVAIMVVN